MKWLLGILGVVALAMFAKTELPAVRRYIKIERM
jgi:hypothetical protein